MGREWAIQTGLASSLLSLHSRRRRRRRRRRYLRLPRLLVPRGRRRKDTRALAKAARIDADERPAPVHSSAACGLPSRYMYLFGLSSWQVLQGYH